MEKESKRQKALNIIEIFIYKRLHHWLKGNIESSSDLQKKSEAFIVSLENEETKKINEYVEEIYKFNRKKLLARLSLFFLLILSSLLLLGFYLITNDSKWAITFTIASFLILLEAIILFSKDDGSYTMIYFTYGEWHNKNKAENS